MGPQGPRVNCSYCPGQWRRAGAPALFELALRDGDAAHGIGEHAQVADVLLEDVTDTLRAAGDQVERVALFQELRLA